MAQLVCVTETPVADLKTGSIVVAGHQARYLGEKAGHLLGYDEWPYTAYGDDGSVAARGTMRVHRDSRVLTVAVHVDGTIVVP